MKYNKQQNNYVQSKGYNFYTIFFTFICALNYSKIYVNVYLFMALQSIAHICHQLNNVHKFFYNYFKNKLKLLNVYLLRLLSKNGNKFEFIYL